MHHPRVQPPRPRTAGAIPRHHVCGAPNHLPHVRAGKLEEFRFASLRHCVRAGEPLNPEIIQTWKRATGITIRDGYGQTETILLCGNYPQA